ncbi:hypothetical protein F9K94_21675 [Brucella tritici]|uniref:Uncharacterized protein n=1 Tax=Brucella tritici TaxID=94626 RepID=A0A7V8B0V4_9HYPH|nr:hypothetical protein [Brucella tritici]KAB2655164.1 hypothetical protein F9K94_21675 [Brucella tritici]
MIEKIRNRLRQKPKEASQPTTEMTQILKDREDQERITATLKRMAAQEFKDNIDPVAPCDRKIFDEKYVFGYALEVAETVVSSVKFVRQDYKAELSQSNKIGVALILLADIDAACLLIADIAKSAPGLLSWDYAERLAVSNHLHLSVIKNLVLHMISETSEGRFIVHEWSKKPLPEKVKILTFFTNRVRHRLMAIQKLSSRAPDIYDLEDWDLQYPEHFLAETALELFPLRYWHRFQDAGLNDAMEFTCTGSELPPFYRLFLPIEALTWFGSVIKIKTDSPSTIPKSIEVDGIRCFIPNSIIGPRTAELFRVARVEHRLKPRLSDLPHIW